MGPWGKIAPHSASLHAGYTFYRCRLT
jgi:hypothetical protein